MESSLLSWIVFLPAIGALGVLIAPKSSARVIAVLASLLTFLLSLTLFGKFFGGGDPAQAGEVFGTQYGFLHCVQRLPWITGERFTIRHPENLLVGRTRCYLPIFDDGIVERMVYVALVHIVKIELLNGRAQARHTRKRKR